MNTDKQNSNIKLIYGYTAQAIKVVDASINRLNIKLGLVFLLDIILIYFFVTIADITPFLHCTLCFMLRAISCYFLIFSLLFCLSGFRPKKSGSLIIPEEHYRLLIPVLYNQSIQLDTAMFNLVKAAIFVSISAMASIQLGVGHISQHFRCRLIDTPRSKDTGIL